MASPRINTIDTIKTSLVVVMFLYHSASCIIHIFPSLVGIVNRLFFVHYAFLLTSGLLCGMHYVSKLQLPNHRVPQRIFLRGSKLLAIFLSLNIISYVIGILSFSTFCAYFESHHVLHFLFVNMRGSLVNFEILYYNALFLLCVPLFITWIKDYQIIALSLFLLFFSFSTVLFCCAYGFLGMGIGMLYQRAEIQNIVSKLDKYLWLFLPLLVARLFYSHVFFNPYLLCVETVVWYGSFLFIFRTFNLSHFIGILGLYTLISYIVQMSFSLVLSKIIPFVYISVIPSYLLVFFISFIFTYAFVLIIHLLRKKNDFVNKIYRLVFL